MQCHDSRRGELRTERLAHCINRARAKRFEKTGGVFPHAAVGIGQQSGGDARRFFGIAADLPERGRRVHANVRVVIGQPFADLLERLGRRGTNPPQAEQRVAPRGGIRVRKQLDELGNGVRSAVGDPFDRLKFVE